MSENNVDTLRQHLFDTLHGIKDKTVSIEQARAITEVSQAIINSAKVEVEFAKAGGSPASAFLGAAPEARPGRTPPALAAAPDSETPTGSVSRPKPGVLIHKLR